MRIGSLPAPVKEPCFFAELLRILFCEVVFVQQGYLPDALQPQQAFLLVLGDAEILDGAGRQCFLIPLDGLDLAVPLNSAPPADGEGAYHALLGTAGNPSGKQIHIGFLSAKDNDFDPHALQRGNGPAIDRRIQDYSLICSLMEFY